MEKDTASQIITSMLEVTSKLNDSARLVVSSADPEESEIFKRTVGGIMGEIYLEVLLPLFKIYPDLTPADLRSEDPGVVFELPVLPTQSSRL